MLFLENQEMFDVIAGFHPYNFHFLILNAIVMTLAFTPFHSLYSMTINATKNTRSSKFLIKHYFHNPVRIII